jgi:hypothetical protein
MLDMLNDMSQRVIYLGWRKHAGKNIRRVEMRMQSKIKA